VVEVGIDAPGATVIVVENAERFGLSQLHQLRGRVGRGSRHSYCFLLSPAVERDKQSAERLKRFCRIHDGFEIAELDLALRGPGQVLGEGQSGWDDGAMRAILEAPGEFRRIMDELESIHIEQ
jgi:ATP-dependent DNA helicase RecG